MVQVRAIRTYAWILVRVTHPHMAPLVSPPHPQVQAPVLLVLELLFHIPRQHLDVVEGEIVTAVHLRLSWVEHVGKLLVRGEQLLCALD